MRACGRRAALAARWDKQGRGRAGTVVDGHDGLLAQGMGVGGHRAGPSAGARARGRLRAVFGIAKGGKRPVAGAKGER
ncbi:hypothetical protein GCM10009802_21160 [Streptomyces synnematoformans]|uniref:Transposase n=1 Tax=Streptomyces synnematoformans TaxID=415721 RepID=A0ABN2XYX1_9ACTN